MKQNEERKILQQQLLLLSEVSKGLYAESGIAEVSNSMLKIYKELKRERSMFTILWKRLNRGRFN